MLYPIYHLLCGEHKDVYGSDDDYDDEDFEPSLELTEDQTVISYKMYKSADTDDMQTIFDDKLTPGILIQVLICIFPSCSSYRNKTPFWTIFSVAGVQHGHQGQAEVSHAMVLDTYDKENDMLIFKNTYDDPENGQPKKFKIARTDPNAPEELYFVHIEIKDMDNLPSQ